MVECGQQLQLLSAIGADELHCLMVLVAAESAFETNLSLNALTSIHGAGSSPSQARARVVIWCTAAVQPNPSAMHAAWLSTVQPCWRARAIDRHYRGAAPVAWARARAAGTLLEGRPMPTSGWCESG